MKSTSFLSRIRASNAAVLLAAAMAAMPVGFGQQRGLATRQNVPGEVLAPPPRPKKLSHQEKREADAWGKLRMLNAETKRLRRAARDDHNFWRSYLNNRCPHPNPLSETARRALTA